MDAEVNVADVVELVLTPFNDIVAKAQNAAANAAAEETLMYKTAESLRKEGQRALNRLEPLYRKIVKQHGLDCVNAIKRNDDISSVHLELTDMLWEFDDYLSVESFDEKKYVEMQSLCRKLAPRVYNILVRMNIELLAQMPSSSSSESTQFCSPESPPAPSLFSLESSDNQWHPSPSQSSSKDERHPSWAESNSIGGSSIRAADVANQDIYSTSASSFALAAHTGGVRPQSNSSGNSARSWNSQSSRGLKFLSRPVMSIRRQSDERLQPASRLRPQPLLLSQRDAPARESEMMQHPPRSVPASRTPSGAWTSDNLQRRVAFEHAAMADSRPSSKHCMITESSSFRRYKGFCLGAQEVLQGRTGVRQKQRPVQRTLLRVVAKCNGCSMELDYGDIETDSANKEAGNSTKQDIGYRLRFLQKCHLPVKRPADVLYGCIFCVSNGFTMEESDATVFFSAEDLFLHLSRHAQPLPPVPGITVLYGVDVPYDLRNNYDLHFHAPPVTHPVRRESTEIAGRPTGVAIKETRRVDSQKKLGDRDRAEELQLAVGARITGIKWPPQYKGRKIFAWHDGSYASVPAENIVLIPPENTRLNQAMRSRTLGKAKWKFSMKSVKELPWLKFDKGDVITNIGWEHPDNWCWCGTNAKGHWGIFPQAFLDPNTVVEGHSSELASDTG